MKRFQKIKHVLKRETRAMQQIISWLHGVKKVREPPGGGGGAITVDKENNKGINIT
jgi:hypothetical protein